MKVLRIVAKTQQAKVLPSTPVYSLCLHSKVENEDKSLREIKAKEIIDNADIIVTTFASSTMDVIKGEVYCGVVLDEAGQVLICLKCLWSKLSFQASEALTFIPASLARKKLVLVGDDCQVTLYNLIFHSNGVNLVTCYVVIHKLCF